MRFFVAVILILPLFTFAQSGRQTELEALLQQLAGLQEQIQTMQGGAIAPGTAPATVTAQKSTASCPALSRTLQRGSEGADVRGLQQFLVSSGYLTAEPTGYFGPLTEKALQDFQAKAGIVSNGSPASTGWGVAGPKTRAAIAQHCGGVTSSAPTTAAPVTTSACGAAPAVPTEACNGTWQRLTSATNCHVGWQCVSFSTQAGNKLPIIAGIDGPTSLEVGTLGSWTVRASDPEGGTLKYSAIWGDEGAGSILSILAGVGDAAYSSSSKLSHAYGTPGTYSVGITVQDAGGATASGRVSVKVAARPDPTFNITQWTQTATAGACTFNSMSYGEGTETEGYNANDLCLASNGVCLNRTSYIPKFKCTGGAWREVLANPYPNLPNYASFVGAQCGATSTVVRGGTKETVVSPGTVMCRGFLCATSQNFAPVTLTCEYALWVDWGIFNKGATTTTICAEPTPCEYSFGVGGRACAAKQNGVCPAPSTGHPLGT